MNPAQLSIFEPLILQRAAQLLENLNDGRKHKFVMQWFFTEKGLYIFLAADKTKDVIFNALDSLGNIPADFPVNWRTWPHVQTELQNYTPK